MTFTKGQRVLIDRAAVSASPEATNEYVTGEIWEPDNGSGQAYVFFDHASSPMYVWHKWLRPEPVGAAMSKTRGRPVKYLPPPPWYIPIRNQIGLVEDNHKPTI